MIQNGETVPCDALVLESTHADGNFYLETSSLDGETGVKPHQTLHQISETFEREQRRTKSSIIRNFDIDRYRALRYFRSAPSPDLRLVAVKLVDESLPLAQRSPVTVPRQCLAFRGSTLMHTQKCIAVAVYGGMETQIMLNFRSNSEKTSNFQTFQDNMIKAIIFVLLLTSLAMTIAQYRASNYEFFPQMIFFLVILNGFIPMSLPTILIGLELLQARQLNKDKKWTSQVQVNNKSSVSDLANIEYFLTDKTGTLTLNQLTFNFISYTSSSGEFKHFQLQTADGFNALIDKLKIEKKQQKQLEDSVRTILICNSAFLNPEFEEIRKNCTDKEATVHDYYLTSNADEAALLAGLSKMNCLIASKNLKKIKISVFNNIEELTFTDVKKDFGSQHKYQLVVVQGKKRYYAYVKGAFETVIRLIDPKSLPNNYVSELRNLYEGCYRVMVLAYGRFEALPTLEDIESKKLLKFLSFTAITDQLADNLQETISSLQSANIRFAIITGDHSLTANKIAQNAGMISKARHTLVLSPDSGEFTHKHFLRMPNLKSDEYAIFDTDMISEVMKCKNKLGNFIRESQCTIFSRATPEQKALIAGVYKNCIRSSSTTILAAGDGLNDLAMFEEANVGIGIAGLEGNFAASCSDISVRQFSDIKRLILAFGPWNYNRLRVVILFYYVHILAANLPIFVFSVYTKYSNAFLWEIVSLNLYYFIWVIPAICSIGLFDRNHPEKYLMEHTEIYFATTRKDAFSIIEILFWLVCGASIGLIIYFVPFYIMQINSIFLSNHNVASITYMNLIQPFTATLFSTFLAMYFLVEFSMVNVCMIMTQLYHLALYYVVLFYFSSKLFNQYIIYKSVIKGGWSTADTYYITLNISMASFSFLFIASFIKLCAKKTLRASSLFSKT
ncbi:MAG: aminophospholipid translocase [Marteilia pararefringens]